MSTHNIGFYEDLTKIIFELSSNTHLISSADLVNLLRKNDKMLGIAILCFFFNSFYKFNVARSSMYSFIMQTCPCNISQLYKCQFSVENL